MTHRIPRWQVKATLDAINMSPWRVLTALVKRRSPVYLRYFPRNLTENGSLVRVGDHMPLNSPDRGNCHIVYDAQGNRYDVRDQSSNRRKGEKIILQDAGEMRWITVKNYDREKGCQGRHVDNENRGAGRNYDPLDHDLYPLSGFYNDGLKVQPTGGQMIGRFGQWRPFTQICMRGIVKFKAQGQTWIVTDPPTDHEIGYPNDEAFDYSRKHVVTCSGMTTTATRPITARPETWEIVMGLAK